MRRAVPAGVRQLTLSTALLAALLSLSLSLSPVATQSAVHIVETSAVFSVACGKARHGELHFNLKHS
jgi:hypothetical protein